MQSIFLKIGVSYLDAWRSHRMFSACKTFALRLDPNMTAQAVYDDHIRQGWIFFLNTEESRDRLAAFHSALHGRVLAERTSNYDPVVVGSYDAATASYAG